MSFVERTVLRVLNEASDAELLVIFWFNHFNVFWRKDLVGAALPDYVDGAIRPHASGRFRDLLEACITHPAMLVYLDNTRNVSGRLNENLARELLELHTLGVDGGYTQADVRETARVLTGLGLRPLHVNATTKLFKGSVIRGEFMFDPRRHESGVKRVLGRSIEGGGYREVEALFDLLTRHPATAHHIARKLCVFLLGDEPGAECQTHAATVFRESDGDLGKTIAAIRHWATERKQPSQPSFKDPFRYVTSAVRLLATGRKVQDSRPTRRWLAALGQPLFGCRTPDGYSLYGHDWISAGQLAQRFELAQEMVNTVPRMLDQPQGAAAVLKIPAVRQYMTSLSPASRQVIDKTRTPEQRLALLLSSPEFMYWQAGSNEAA